MAGSLSSRFATTGVLFGWSIMQFASARIRTHDFDEYLAWEHSAGIDSEQTQLTRGRGEVSAAFATFGELFAWRHQSSERMLCHYLIPAGMVELCVCRHPTPTLWCDAEFAGTTVVIHCEQQPYRAIISPEGVSYGCLISKESLFRYGLLTERQYSLAASRKFASAPAHDGLVDELLRHLDSLLGERDSQYALEQPIYTFDAVLSAWQQVLDRCWAPTSPEALQKPAKDRSLLENFLNLVDSDPNKVFTAGRVADELQVTRRTLERSVRRQLGMSPYQYLLTRRLHLARRLLKDGQDSVLSACVNTGFEHSGRFAMTYVRQFGELPSQTQSQGRRDELI